MTKTIENETIIILNDVRKKGGEVFHMAGTKFLTFNRPNAKGAGGIAIGAKKGSSLKILSPEDKEEILVEISWQGHSCLIAGLYNRPGNLVDKEFLHRVMEEQDKDKNRPLFICGDLNAPHEAFGSRTTNRAGEALLEYVIDKELVYTDNVEPTYYNASQGNTNILDMFFLNTSAERDMECLEVMGDIGSDHKPLKLICRRRSLERNPKKTFEVIREDTMRKEIEKAAINRMRKWDEKVWITPDEAEEEVQAMTKEWTEIKKNASFTKTIRTRDGVILSEESRRLIKEMRRAGRGRKRSDLGEQEANKIRRLHNRLKREVRRKVKEDEKNGILESLRKSTESRDPAGTWRILNNSMGRNIRDEWIYPIKDSRGILQVREEEIAKIHMNRMKDTCSLASDPTMDDEFKRKVEEEVNNLGAITDLRDRTAWSWRENEMEDIEFGDEDFSALITKTFSTSRSGRQRRRPLQDQMA